MATTTSKTIDELTDAELARMVRESTYVRNTRFGTGEDARGRGDARFLLLLAIPYGQQDFPQLDRPIVLADAIEAFATFVQDYDWPEREFQVYDHEAPQHFFEANYAGLERPEDEVLP